MTEMQPRSCWVLQGGIDWCQDTVTTLLSNHLERDTLWISPSPPLQVKSKSSFLTLSPKQAHTMLGQEMDIVVFDANAGCDPDALGAVGGVIRSGGVLVLLLPEEDHPLLWQKHFETILEADAKVWIKEGESLPELTINLQAETSSSARYRTEDQRIAVTAIEKVALGRRRRPLVLTSDRGRGKSAALGIAAAHLLRAGKQRIVVTGPSLAAVSIVFEHAAELLPATAIIKRGLVEWEKKRLEFVATDALLLEEGMVDLLLVDEAAAIPSPILAGYLKQFSRIVFATTLHGYEGSGRGFAIRFQAVLAEECPDYKQYNLTTPVRWLPNDPLEKLLFDALLLDATAAAVGLSSEINPENCEVMRVERSKLAEDKVMLRGLFGLMVMAHYRTRPSDLRILLEHPAVSVWVMRYQGKVVAGTWSIDEGGLDEELAQAVHAGKRRIKGHLLPQTLVNHAGEMSAASLRYQRVMRIAVHPELQGRGLGTGLLQAIETAGQKQGIDLMGASFGADVSLINFWAQSGYTPIRLGVKQNDTSGYHSAVVLRSFSSKGDGVLSQAKIRFALQWPYLLSGLFQKLPSELVLMIAKNGGINGGRLSQYDSQDVLAFAHAQRDFESSHYALSQWLLDMNIIAKIDLLSLEERQGLIMAILQRRSWLTIGRELGLSGKSEILVLLRNAVRLILDLTRN